MIKILILAGRYSNERGKSNNSQKCNHRVKEK